MKVFRTNYGKGIYLDDGELVALGFIAVNLLGKTGIPFLDEYANKTTPTLLSDGQMAVLDELLNSIRKEQNNG